MSGHSISAIILFVGVAAIALASQEADNHIGRAPASIKKELTASKGPGLKYTKKIHGPIESKIELVGAVPEKAGDVFVLKGLVSTSEELNNVEFKWDIPAGVELVNGAVTGTISNLKAEFPTELQVTLRSAGGENHQVHLLAATSEKGTRFSDTAQFNTLLQPLVEETKQVLLKQTMEANPHKAKGPKAIH